MTAETRPEVAKIEGIKTEVTKTGRELGVQKVTAETAVDAAVAELKNVELTSQAIETEQGKAETAKREAEAIKEGGGA